VFCPRDCLACPPGFLSLRLKNYVIVLEKKIRFKLVEMLKTVIIIVVLCAILGAD
jgi:hypothetical protein